MKAEKIINASNIHIGEIIKKHIDNKRIYKSALARKLNRSDSAIIRYQKSSSLQTDLLLAISHALKHNFFADIAAQLPNTYTTNISADTTKDERIAELEQEIALLKAKNEVLLEAMKR